MFHPLLPLKACVHKDLDGVLTPSAGERESTGTIRFDSSAIRSDIGKDRSEACISVSAVVRSCARNGGPDCGLDYW